MVWGLSVPVAPSGAHRLQLEQRQRQPRPLSASPRSPHHWPAGAGDDLDVGQSRSQAELGSLNLLPTLLFGDR